jgi:hypothetical protein
MGEGFDRADQRDRDEGPIAFQPSTWRISNGLCTRYDRLRQRGMLNLPIAYVWHASVFTREVLNGNVGVRSLYRR